MSARRTFQILLGSLKNYLMKVMRGIGPNISLLTVTLPIKTACKVFDESWCPLLARLPCKNRNDLYETDYDLAHLFYRRERIKLVLSWWNFITDRLHRQGRIKRHHCRRIFYGVRQIIMYSQKYKSAKICKEWYRVLGIFSYIWSAKLF